MNNLNRKLTEMVLKAQAKNNEFPFQCIIRSKTHALDIVVPNDQEHTPFHIASIGKLISTVALFKLVENHLCKLDDPLTNYVDASLLIGLFISDPPQITLLDCIQHRTGAADFFEAKDKKGKSFIDKVISNKDELYSSKDLLDYARTHLKPVGPKGQQFAYGDTAFLCLMLAMEKISGQSIPNYLDSLIFKPLQMTRTQSMIYTQKNPLKPLPIMVNKIDIASFESLSCDQGDGGIVSSPHDLLLFMHALYHGFIWSDHLKLMQKWQGHFRNGIHYGSGMMQIRFEEFFFLMKNYPRLEGHIGILSTHLYHDPLNDIQIVLNFGSTQNMTKSFTFLSQVMGLLKKELNL